MPRYVVERTFPDGLPISGAEAAEVCLAVVERNADEGVTWVHSYVSDGPAEDILRLRRPEPGGDPKDGGPQRAPGRPHHPGSSSRSVFLG